MAADGNMEEEFNHRLKEEKEFGVKVNQSTLSHKEAIISFECVYRAKIGYVLPVSTFSSRECHQIGSAIRGGLFHRMGVSRKLPRGIVQGIQKRGGLGYDSIETIQ